jgi:hypothetical protein
LSLLLEKRLLIVVLPIVISQSLSFRGKTPVAGKLAATGVSFSG